MHDVKPEIFYQLRIGKAKNKNSNDVLLYSLTLYPRCQQSSLYKTSQKHAHDVILEVMHPRNQESPLGSERDTQFLNNKRLRHQPQSVV